VDFRTGDLAVLAAAPGGGKSLVATNWAWRSQDPILYLAQDSPRSILKRFTALALGRRVSDIGEEDIDYWSGRIAEQGKREELVIATGSHNLDQLDAKLVALTEWLMQPPTLVFIDNLFDMRSEGNSYMDTGFYADLLPSLKQMAIRHDVGMVLLHHVTRGDEHGLGTERIRMKDLLFAGEREARHVWGVYRPRGNQVNVSILKNQDGAAEPSGGLYVTMDWHPEENLLLSR